MSVNAIRLKGMVRTWEGAHPCTGSQSCFPCKTGMVLLRHTSAFVFDNGYTPAWRVPACALLADLLHLHTGPCKGSAQRSLGRTAALVVVVDGTVVHRCGVSGSWSGCTRLTYGH